MIAVVQGWSRLWQQAGETLLALDQGPRADILAVEMEEIEQKKHEAGSVAGVGRELDHAERGDAVGAHAAQFAVEVSLTRGERRYCARDLRIFVGPVEAVAGEEPHLASVEARMHAEAVEFDFVQPLVALPRRLHELRQLRLDPLR